MATLNNRILSSIKIPKLFFTSKKNFVSSTLPQLLNKFCRHVPDFISRPDYIISSEGSNLHSAGSNSINLYSEDVLVKNKYRETCQIAARIRQGIKNYIISNDNITTDDVDKFAHDLIIENNCYPSMLGFPHFSNTVKKNINSISDFQKFYFPKSVSININSQVCHCIPNNFTHINRGDIINIDLTIYRNHMHADCATTFIIPSNNKNGKYNNKISEEKGKKLLQITKAAQLAAINACKPQSKLYSIGEAINNVVKSTEFSIVEDFSGHGIGYNFHELPFILHFPNYNSINQISMLPGMIFTIEPMITEHKTKLTSYDDWYVKTEDGSRSAMFEDVILITDTGAQVLTKL